MSSMGETLYNTVARSMRSVFIGNLPLDTTEDQLKEICSEIGPLINVKIFTDNDSNKPKVYGFCEYKDKEMAQSAVRNLDGYLLRNSPLRVHIASSEKSKEEMESLQGLVTEQGEV
ncbi:Cleavage stimulation factor subunit 2, partial [Stegodyphus mimosarum]